MHWTILNSGDQEVLPAKAQGRPRKTKTFVMYGLPYIRFLTCPATLVVADRAPLDPGKSLLSSPCPRPQSGSIREGLGGCFKQSRVVVGGGAAHPRGGTRCPPRIVPGPRHLAPDLLLPSASLAERQGGAGRSEEHTSELQSR